MVRSKVFINVFKPNTILAANFMNVRQHLCKFSFDSCESFNETTPLYFFLQCTMMHVFQYQISTVVWLRGSEY